MRILVMLALSLICNQLLAEEQIVEFEKKWEFGLGIGDIYSPDYRGSDEYNNYFAPIPYVIYRGKYIQSDRDGIRGNVFKSDRYEFTFSATATISQKADENRAREDMPELGSTVEMGPALNIKLTEADATNNVVLQIPLRAVIAVTGSERGYKGLVFEPQFMFRRPLKSWDYTQRVGISIANRDYHDYYYSIDQEFVTPERSFFEAAGGYSGVFTQIALSRPFQIHNEQTKLAFFLRYENIDNAAFVESPLVKTNHVLRGGFAVVWVIK
ncbi:MAG: MipA/OmpV family protein [Gammaproteobacteria bacterium]|nr:MAG: MipA/OmpV family protein [Gammaproteobacteria bacterium]